MLTDLPPTIAQLQVTLSHENGKSRVFLLCHLTSSSWRDSTEGCSFFVLVSSPGLLRVCDGSPAADTHLWHFSSDLSRCFDINTW